MSDLSQPPTRVAVVTGASRGLGAAFSRVLSEVLELRPGAVDTWLLRSAFQTPEH